MADLWTPTLALRETGMGCRLSLIGVTQGEGMTLQDAADDLVARLLEIAMRWRAGGCSFSGELGVPDRSVMHFLYEVSEVAARGEDVWAMVLGPPR
jgi:hypothetical protein